MPNAKMLPRSLWLAAVLALGVNSQSSDSTAATSDVSSASSASRSSSRVSASGSGTNSQSVVTLTGSQTSSAVFTGGMFSYKSLGSQITASTLYADETSTSSSSSRTGSSSSGTGSTTTTTSASKGSTSLATLLVGGGGIVTQSIINGTVTLSSHLNSTRTSSASGTGTGTSSSAQPTNTTPCNNYPEFCNRKYGNITEVVAHNAAFNQRGNLASNQDRSVTVQLNDGIRMIQGETHYVNGSIYSCHTSCDLLNAGTYLSELNEVAAWVRDHPYDVVTLLIVNSDFIEPGNYSNVLQQSDLADYLYEPPYIPMRLDQWPTLSEMILSQKRVVAFMDYNADQTKYPYLLDEFTHMWETPFSPTDRAFPCTTQRPPDLDQKAARNDLMYLANHNLNTNVALFGQSILIPNSAELNVTNAATIEYGSLGAANENCTETWNRPPTWLLVDYYDFGDGSVFEVAAKANGVTYNRACCGATSTSAAANVKGSALALLVALIAALGISM
ncbi:PLC-like phosphodiesterase [Aureobasidium pullulans]|nr:PLC-like phosphodiesterase [Aureobasidium pullulans]